MTLPHGNLKGFRAALAEGAEACETVYKVEVLDEAVRSGRSSSSGRTSQVSVFSSSFVSLTVLLPLLTPGIVMSPATGLEGS